MLPKKLPHTIHANYSVLRRLKIEDIDPFHRFVSNDNNVQYMFFEDEQRTYDGAKAMIEWTINSYETDTPVWIFAIADKTTDEYLGNVGAQVMEGTTDIEFFYTLLPEHHGQGYVDDALRAFLTYLFKGGIETAVAIIVPENQASIKVAERLKARFIGHVKVNGNSGIRYEIDKDTSLHWT